MTEKEVVKLMLSASGRDDWNKKCDKVKAAFNNDYPGFWYGAIILSGVINKAKSNNGW